MNHQTKDKAMKYLTGHYHEFWATVKHQDKLKLIKFSAWPD